MRWVAAISLRLSSTEPLPGGQLPLIDVEWPATGYAQRSPVRQRRMPARTRSMMRLRSSSARAPMMMTTARPSGPPVSRFSRKLTNSMLRGGLARPAPRGSGGPIGRSGPRPTPNPPGSGRGGHPEVDHRDPAGEPWFLRSGRCTRPRSENPAAGAYSRGGRGAGVSRGPWSTVDTRRYRATVCPYHSS